MQEIERGKQGAMLTEGRLRTAKALEGGPSVSLALLMDVLLVQ